jgi:hypothetical protein
MVDVFRLSVDVNRREHFPTLALSAERQSV